MPDFDVPNIGKARAALTALAKEPRPSRSMSIAKTQLVRALYTEIRQARLAGHTWREIYIAVRDSNVSPRMSVGFLTQKFHEIDKQFERETGVKALPTDPGRGKASSKKSVA